MAFQFEINAVTPFRQSCTLIWDNEVEEVVLTDVGGDVPYLLQQVQNKDLRLTTIWLTHGRLDHAGGVVELLETCDVPVLGPHKDDGFLLQVLPQTTARYSSPVSPSFMPTCQLEEGETLKIGNHGFQALHILGHIPGQAVFYNAKNELLITDDVLFYEIVSRTDFPHDDYDGLINNICARLLTLPENTQVIAGYDHVTNIGHKERYSPSLVR